MKSIVWKEMRELLLPMGIAGAVLLWLALLFLSPRLHQGPLLGYWAAMPLLTLLAAIALGVGQVARERASKTLDFLLARPIAPEAIVWSKFLVGTVALALLVLAIAAPAYAYPQYRGDAAGWDLREGIAFPQLAAALFARAWCVYAFSLLCSVMVNRVASGVMALACSAMALAGLARVHGDLVPFSDPGAWLPSADPNVLARLACDPELIHATGIGLSMAAILPALAAGLLFRRSPSRVLSDKVLWLGSLAMLGVFVLAARAELNLLPVLAPAGTLELRMNSGHDLADMDAGGGTVSVAAADSLAFLDFADPAKPRKVSEAPMPLWKTESLTLSGGETYILGTKKAVPVDERQIAIARLGREG